ncbi:MAG: 30S ribosomal protein S5 [Parcubacteria group bacterium GW2011_GWA2_38_13]|nr:MAG: 30S ribosomal protein S5 [Parcubacteria group bacterium GW2011_GWA2_38_13]
MEKKRKQSGDKFMRSADSEREFKQEVIDLARVTRVMAGGKRMRFRACIAIGDGAGRVGIGVAKGADVTIAINKAATKARKHIVSVPIINATIPYPIQEKYGSAIVLIKPAPVGTGIKAGGSMRIIFSLAGMPNIVGKILGASNKINNVKATINAIKKLRYIEVKQKDKKDQKSQEVISAV